MLKITIIEIIIIISNIYTVLSKKILYKVSEKVSLSNPKMEVD